MSDFLPLNGTDHIEIYVGNAKQSAHYFKTAFGFQDLAYAGLETGLKDRTSYVLRQDKIILVLTSPLTSTSPVNDHLVKHGDGVKTAHFGSMTPPRVGMKPPRAEPYRPLNPTP